MLKTEQKMEIKRLNEQGLNMTQIADQLKIDWKTVKKVLAQNGDHGTQKPDQANQSENSQEDNELTKVIFEKLNSGVHPRKIVAEVGHVDLVTNLYERWKKLICYTSENLRPPDPQIGRSPEAWVQSFQKYPEWHQKKAIRAVCRLAVWVTFRCPYFRSKDPDCKQISQVPDPYGCLECERFYNILFNMDYS